jgi:recombination protein RecR
MQDEYNKLFEYFKGFPGIGKRQAERFVFHILTKENSWVDNFMFEIKKSRDNVRECVDCFRVFKNKYGEKFELCDICRSTVRDRSILAVVERNIDAEVMLKKANWTGLIFILGGQFQVIEKKNPPHIHLEGLLKFVSKLAVQSGGAALSPALDRLKENTLKEIVICTSLNPDGVFTASVLQQKIRELLENQEKSPFLEGGQRITNAVKITTFGRGFSTGTELEYADKDTLQNALLNRGENFF